MSDWLPRKTGERWFIGWLAFLALLSLATQDWSTAIAWASATTGWYVASIEGDQVDQLLTLHRSGTAS